jgi:hypothetical protein
LVSSAPTDDDSLDFVATIPRGTHNMVVVGGYDCCDTPNTWTFGIDGGNQENISTDSLDDVYVAPVAPVDDSGAIEYKSVPYTDDP